jgi:TonB-dependent receptor
MNAKIWVLAGIISLLLGFTGAQAQSEAEQASGNDADAIDEVIVKGYRGSLKAALDIKRTEVGFTDSIVASDISDLADQNLAEAIQRVPGIAVVRDHGKAEKVGVRNLPPSFTHTSINQLATTSAVGREVDFSVFASEIVQSVTVRKSPLASEEEGGVAGTINITTARPFAYDGFSFAGSVEAAYNDYSEETDPRASFQVSNTFGDGKFGVLFSLASEDRSFRYDNVYGGGAERRTMSRLNMDPEGPGLPAELSSINYIEFLQQRINSGVEERLGGTLALDFRVSDNLTLGADVMVSDYERIKEQYIHEASISKADGVSDYSFDADANLLTSATSATVPSKMKGKIHPQKEEYKQYSLNAEWLSGDWAVNALAGVSEADYDRRELTWDYLSDDIPSVSYSYEGDLVIPRFSGVTDVYDPAIYSFDKAKDRIDESTDEKSVFQVAVERALDSNVIENVRFGTRYSAKKYYDNRFDSPSFKTTQSGDPLDNTAAQDGARPIDGFGSGFSQGSNLGDPQYVPYQNMLSGYFDVLGYEPSERAQDYYEVEEDVLAAYIEADLSFNLGRFPTSAIIGGRYVESDVTGLGYIRGAGDGDISVDNASYSDFLPRPALSDLTGRWNVNNTRLEITAGNPDLQPLEADQFDLGLEFYFGDESLLAFAYFYKDLKSFFTTTEESSVMFDNGNGEQEFTLIQKANGEGAKIKGVELIYQTPFDFLPAPWDGFGVNLNYSYVDSTMGTTLGNGDPVELKDLSDHTYNAILYYENDKFDARIAYNYRTESLLNSNGIGKFRDDYGQADFAAGYYVTDKLKLTLKVINLFDEASRSYTSHNSSYLNESSFYGRRISFGLRAVF